MKQVKFRIVQTILPLLIGMFLSLGAYAQQITVKGHVKDAMGEPVIGANVIASKLEDTFLTEETLFYEQFYAYVSRKESSFKHDMIRTSDITGEHLWLLDEGHCFRDQLVRFCQMEAVKVNQMAYRLGSMETFMRMVESGKGITFIPELADAQCEAV